MLSFDARRVQGALFDLDGTLVDSLPDLHFAVCEVLKSWGLEPMEEEEVGRYIGKGAIHLAAEVLRARKPDATAEERDRFVKEYVNTLAGMAHPGDSGCSRSAWNFPLGRAETRARDEQSRCPDRRCARAGRTLPVFSDRPQAFRGRCADSEARA